jgi:hypothetical protein
MLTVYPPPVVSLAHAAIGAAAARMLLTREDAPVHPAGHLVLLACVLTIAFLAMASRIYRQTAMLALHLAAQLLRLVAFLCLSLLLLGLAGAVLVLILLHA